ncbi:MAG TPA: hypothetical protein VLA09_13205 [Longimicrobiales bacterium]|nr:hypothetical protein [Longimicrobiales bacterium]
MDSWLARTGHPRGAVVGLEQMWALARRWYSGRLEADWRGRSAEEAEAILDSVGLTGEFWRLA